MDDNKPASSDVQPGAPPLPPPPPMMVSPRENSKESQRHQQPQMQQQNSPRPPLQTNLPDLNKLQSSQQSSKMMAQQQPTYDNRFQQHQKQQQPPPPQQQPPQQTTGQLNQASMIPMGSQQEQINYHKQASFQQPPPQIQPLLAPDSSNDVNSSTVINVPSTNIQQQEQASPQKSIITKVKLSDELNIFDWFRTTDILNQIAERARHSMDTVITALDPGMKEYLYSGGNINIMVISDSENSVSPIRDSFQTAFGRATVTAAKYDNSPAPQFPIHIARGFEGGLHVARERIRRLRLNTEMVPQNQVILALQPCIVSLSNELKEVGEEERSLMMPKHQITYCMLIEDPVLMTSLSSYSQLIPIDEDIVAMGSGPTEANFREQHHLGFTQTIDDLMNSRLRLAPREPGYLEDCQWLSTWAGLSESQLIRDLSSSLANCYRRKWDECVN